MLLISLFSVYHHMIVNLKFPIRCFKFQGCLIFFTSKFFAYAETLCWIYFAALFIKNLANICTYPLFGNINDRLCNMLKLWPIINDYRNGTVNAFYWINLLDNSGIFPPIKLRGGKVVESIWISSSDDLRFSHSERETFNGK